MKKNPHAVALGRLGGAKGGLARAKALSARRRREIAKQAATARSRALSPSKRRELARRAAAARWFQPSRIVTAAEAPAAVRKLVRTYEPNRLRWARLDHRYLLVREILVRGSNRAVAWLRTLLSPRDIRELVRRFGGAGCSEPDRQKLRTALGLSVNDIPVRTDFSLNGRSIPPSD